MKNYIHGYWIGQFLATKNWGKTSEETRDYFSTIAPYMLKNEPIPASYGKKSLVFTIGSRVKISTYDISGEDFRQTMEIFSSSVANPKGEKSVRQFLNLIENSVGLIVVVDLARRITSREAFNSLPNQPQHILDALAEQVVPLCRGVEYTMRVNKHMGDKTLTFIFTKTDIHGQSSEKVKTILTTAYAPLFSHLTDEGITHQEFCVAYTGCDLLSDGTVEYGVQGIEPFVRGLHSNASKE